MIPDAAELSRIAELEAGPLAEAPVAVLFRVLAENKRTGTLKLERGAMQKTVVFDRGVLVDCRSNLVHETFGRYLVGLGRLGELDFQTCLAQCAARDLPLGEVLLERNLITPLELFRLLQQNLAKKLLDLFSWSDGHFRLDGGAPWSGSSLKVNVPQLVLTGITRFADQDAVNVAIGEWVGKTLARHPEPPFPWDEIRLSTAQAELVERLRVGSRMDQLAAGSALPFADMNRLLYALAILGMVAPIESLPPSRETVPVIALPTLSARSGRADAGGARSESGESVPALGPEELERRSNLVTQAYLRYRKQDAYELLGVEEYAAPELLEARYLEYAARFAPWRFTAPGLDSVAGRARELFLAGARAYGELTDAERRDTLLYRRKNLREQAQRRPAASHAIKTDLLDPEVQFRKGRALLAGGLHRAAILQFSFASDCDPGNGLYRAELAWCRYQESPPTAARQAVRDLEEALRLDPQCGQAAYYAGVILGELGNREEAELQLRRASKLLAPDRRPIDALKELAAKKRR